MREINIIASVLIDKNGHIKWTPKSFKPNEADICITNFNIGFIGKKSLFYVPLDFNKDYMNETCWTVEEVKRRLKEENANTVKIFTRIQDFYDEINELQFAYTDTLDSYDETLDMDKMKEFCNNAEREYLGEKNNIKFFRYIIKKS